MEEEDITDTGVLQARIFEDTSFMVLLTQSGPGLITIVYGQLLTPYLVKRIGEVFTIHINLLVMLIGNLFLGYVTPSYETRYMPVIPMMFTTSLEGLAHGCFIYLLSLFGKPEDHGSNLGIAQFGNSIGRAAFPIVFGQLADIVDGVKGDADYDPVMTMFLYNSPVCFIAMILLAFAWVPIQTHEIQFREKMMKQIRRTRGASRLDLSSLTKHRGFSVAERTLHSQSGAEGLDLADVRLSVTERR
ncbi:hypothetical protein ADUPG1_006984 [Aduncisulcus paluster]|uniref:Uncharacterized protein n=1 Tax=Aduncisulcus paluster TaxID=2918883 RepID=A0ABQ5KKB1_9EUKA|nr:hypothetical protein ADUPG1_006984 [Aduncisulcus paluster]